MPLYMMEAGSLRVIYLNFHKSICPREFYERGGGPGGNPLSPNSSETAWNFKMPFYKIEVGSLRMVYVNFDKPTCPSEFSMIAKLSVLISQTGDCFTITFGEIVAGDVSYQLHARML